MITITFMRLFYLVKTYLNVSYHKGNHIENIKNSKSKYVISKATRALVIDLLTYLCNLTGHSLYRIFILDCISLLLH